MSNEFKIKKGLVVEGDARVTGAILDSTNAPGTSGQVLTSTVTGTDWKSLAEISGVDGTGTANYLSKWADADTITNSIVYDNGTNVGIGTASPSKKLEVVSNTTYDGIQISGASIPTLAIIDTTNNAKFVAYVRDSDATIGMETNHPLTINTNNTERVRIDSSGATSFTGSSSLSTAVASIQHYSSNGYLYIKGGAGGLILGDDSTASRIQIEDNSNIRFETASAERMRITAGGNVGIGTTSPSEKLSLYTYSDTSTGVGTAINITSDGPGGDIGYIGVNKGTGNGLIIGESQRDIIFQTGNSSPFNGTERLRITSSGNVGIGTTSPLYKLQVQDRIHIEDTTTLQPKISFSENTTTTGEFVLEYNGVGSGAGNYVSFYSEVPGWVGKGNGLNYVPQNGNVGIGTTSPATPLDVVSNSGATGITLRGRSSDNIGTLSFADNAGNVSSQVQDRNGAFWLTTIDASPIVFNTSSAERMRITADGGVGIGTTSPGARLDVNGAANIKGTANFAPVLTLGTAGAINAVINSADEMFFNIDSDNNQTGAAFWFGHNSNQGDTASNLMIIKDSGNVGIGTTSPGDKLDVNGGVRATSFGGRAYPYNSILGSGADASTGTVFAGSTSTYVSSIDVAGGGATNPNTIILKTASAERMRIGTNGYVGVGLSSPTAPIDIKENNYNLWGISGQNVRRALQKYVGYAGDYNQHVILLHPIYDGTTINLNMAAGKIYATRGSTGSGLISDEYEVLTESAYASTTYNLIGKNGSGALYTCYYNGIKYIALIPTYRTSAVAYYFDGYYNNTTGDGLIVVPYRISNTSVILNTEINNSLTLLTGPVAINFRSPVNIAGAMGVLGSITPSVNNTYTLGGGSNKWSQIWGTRFFADDGSVGSPTYTFAGDQDTGFWKPGDGILATSTNGAERMRITSAGNVGIGTTAPAAKLDIAGKAHLLKLIHNNGYIEFLNTADNARTGYLQLNSDSGSALNVTVNQALHFATNNANRLTLSASGNVGIGTESPGAKLVVAGSSPEVQINNSDTNTLALGGFSSGRHFIKSINLGIALTPLTLQASSFTFDTGNVGIGTTNPNAKLEIGSAYGDAIILKDNRTATSGEYEHGIRFSHFNNYVNGLYFQHNDYLGITKDKFLLKVGNGTKMVVDYSGNVGIGTTSPTHKLDIFSTSSRISSDNSSYTAWFIANTGTGNAGTYFDAINGDFSGNDYGFIGQHNAGFMEYTIGAASPAPYHVFSGGNVGIGTTAPASKLDVVGSGAYDGAIRVRSTSTNTPAAVLGVDAVSSADGYVGTINNWPFQIRTNDVGRIHIDTSGNVGIGTTSPAQKLDVVGKMKISDDIILAQTNGRIDYDNGVSSGALRFFSTSGNSERMRITSAGNVGIGTTVPAAKLDVRGADLTPGDGNQTLSITNTTGGTQLNMGTAENNYGWIEAREGATLRNLLLNPNGGNVGIGTTSPGAKLEVRGNAIIGENSYIPYAISNRSVLMVNGTSTSLIGLTTGGTESAYIYHSGVDLDISQRKSGGNILFFNTGSERMRITSAGNVGIGTTVTGTKLHVKGTGEILRIESSNINLYQAFNANGTDIGYIGNGVGTIVGGSANDFGMQAPNNFVIATGGATERMRIDASGNVGIGTTSPTQKLEVNGNIKLSSAAGSTATPSNIWLGNDYSNGTTRDKLKVYLYNSGTEQYGFSVGPTSDVQYHSNILHDFYVANSLKVRINGSGNVGIGTTSPSHKLHVSGDRIVVENITNAGIMFRTASVDRYSVASTGGDFQIYDEVNLSNRLAITSGGDVGIGTTSPTEKLDVNGVVNATSFSAGGTAGFTGMVNFPSNPPGSQMLEFQGGLLVGVS